MVLIHSSDSRARLHAFMQRHKRVKHPFAVLYKICQYRSANRLEDGI